MEPLAPESEQLDLRKSLKQSQKRFEIEQQILTKAESLVGVVKAVDKFKSLLRIHKAKHKTSEEIAQILARIGKPVPSALEVISSTPPFSFLPRKVLASLAEKFRPFYYEDGDVIFSQGVPASLVHVLAAGQVLRFDVSVIPQRLLGFFAPPAYFGAWSSILEQEVSAEFIAGSDVVTYVIDKAQFLEILATPQAVSLRHAMIRTLRTKERLFGPIDAFVALVTSGVSSGNMDFAQIVSAYSKMTPAIHSKIHQLDAIDTSGWLYAVRRLPDNVTHNSIWLVCRSVPPIYASPSLATRAVPSAARRRAVFALNETKSIVVMREDFSDVLDFVSMLCCHAVESMKLRHKLGNPRCFQLIRDFVEASGITPTCAVSEDPAKQKEVLSQLPLTDEEREGLRRIWPKDVIHRLWDIIIMHENFAIMPIMDNTYEADTAERWTELLRKSTVQLIGEDAFADENLEVHIISSNTHSVTNCLSPFLHMPENAAKVEQWGATNMPAVANSPVFGRPGNADRLYAFAYGFLKAHPDAATERTQTNLRHGILTLNETEFTGIAVDFIDVDKLDLDHVDPHLLRSRHAAAAAVPRRRRLIVNIDYAFGRQAEDIIRCLILLYGRRIASVNVMGKAGALQGNRGDLILTTHLILQHDDDITQIPHEGITADSLTATPGAEGRNVWEGGVLTVTGTLLQDRPLLHFYKRLWDCVSLEMEGTYYAKEVSKFQKVGYLNRHVAKRYLYYVSDLPLDTHSNLATSLGADEGIPPLYAITRALLEQVLYGTEQPESPHPKRA